jgi:cytochrome c1
VILVRPDGYVAWAGDDQLDLADQAGAAVARWCGSRASRAAGGPVDPSGAACADDNADDNVGSY